MHNTHQANSPGVLEYSSPRSRGIFPRPPNPVVATILHLPGSFCWMIYLGLITKWYRPGSSADFLILAGLAWPVAAITAIISLFVYLPGGWRKPWYVWLNLAINTSGLLFTACVPSLAGGYFGSGIVRMQDKPQSQAVGVLEYSSARPRKNSTRLPSPIDVTILHLAGSYCWAVFAWMHADWVGIGQLEIRFGLMVFAAVLWPVAVVNALRSVAVYVGGGFRKPWYVWLNLVINISGLLFTLCVPIVGWQLFGM